MMVVWFAAGTDLGSMLHKIGVYDLLQQLVWRARMSCVFYDATRLLYL